MIVCGIYKIENLITHHIYVGQSVNIYGRWGKHRTSSADKKFDTPLYRAIRKYGLENFSFEIVEECSRELLDDREKYWINHYNSYHNGYNQTLGGQGNLWKGNSLTLELVEQIREELRATEQTNMEIAVNYGVSENTISGINTGYYWKDDNITYPIRTPNHKARSRSFREKASRKTTSDNKKYRHLSKRSGDPIGRGLSICPICKKKFICYGKTGMCAECAHIVSRKVIRPSKEELYSFLVANQGNFALAGRQYGVTDTSVRKWCKAYGLSFHSKDYQLPREPKPEKKAQTLPKAVAKLDRETGEILATYHSIYEAEQMNNISHIGQVCNGKRKSTGGYKWKFI